MKFTIRRLTLSAAAVGALALLVAAVAGAGGAAPGRTVLAGRSPRGSVRSLRPGPCLQAQTISAKVWLAPEQRGRACALAKAVADPASAQYRHYLSHSQYVSQFAPTAAQVAAVKTWLTGAGLTVTSVGPDNHYLAVTGAASARLGGVRDAARPLHGQRQAGAGADERPLGAVDGRRSPCSPSAA